MEMLEPVAVAFPPGDPSTCPYCSEKDRRGRTNDLDNNSTRLGSSLGSHDDPEPSWMVEIEHPGAGFMTFENELRTNAHHLIPGDATLNPHPRIKKFIEQDDEINDDIGYGVNHAKNGVWLPSYPREFQETRSTGREISWGEMKERFPEQQHRIAVQIMRTTQRQFHDSHPKYSEFASECLDKLCERLVAVAMKHTCGGEAEEMPKPWPAPYALVGWLDGVSNRLKGFLIGGRKNWKPPVFTSSHARTYHATGR